MATIGLHVNRVVRSWLMLAVSAMGLSALLAVLLVVSRTPGVQALFGLHDLFHSVLVLHVNFSVLVWLLAFAALLWSRGPRVKFVAAEGVAFGLALLGALLMVAALFVDEGGPVLSNYIPVLDSPLFLTGLLAFGGAVTLVAAIALFGRLLRGELLLAALAWLVVVALLAYHLSQLLYRDAWHYEHLFWGAGHQLQFVYLLLLFFVWRQASGVRAGIVDTLALLPIAAALLLGVALDPQSESSRTAFTHLMQFGSPLLLIPVLWRILPNLRQADDPALRASVGLMVTGLAIGLLISGDTVMVTAHYHATNAAITVAFMGYGYRMLTELGFVAPHARFCRWQVRLYTAGMALYIAGMALSGWLGVPRKSAAAVNELAAQLTMGVMGIGGLISVIATLFFVCLMGAAMMRRPALTLENTMERPL